MNRRMLLTALCALTISMTSFASDGGDVAAQGGGGTQRILTPLSGAAINHEKPTGHADFQTEPAKKRTSFTVEVEDVNLPDGTVLSVAVIHNGAQTTVGSLTLAAQFGQMELRSQDGDVFPQIHKGDMVVVSNGATAILTGVF